jgi:hypothetical protein
MSAPQGHAQVKLIGPDGRTGVRVPLGNWPDACDQFRDEPWHGPLYSAFKNSMSALQRHEQVDTQAAMAKASNAPPVPQDERERFEFRHLNREMDVLEKVDLDKITADLAARRNALSPFAAPIDKTDANTAALRTELRGYLRAVPPMDRLKALRADVDEATASAILSAPPQLSGLSAEQWGNFREARLRQLHPEKSKALDAANAAAKLTARCLYAARTSTRTRIAPFLPPVEIEPKTVTAPWVA